MYREGSDWRFESVRISDVQEITDPRGTSVYWVWGPMKEEFTKGTDIHTILIEKKVSISPIHISISALKSSISHLELETN